MATAQDDTRLAVLLHKVQAENATLNTARVQRALEVAREVYAGKTHWSGEPLIDYVSGVLEVLLQFEPDEDAIISCILHQLLTGEDWNLIQLESEFGSKVRSLVSGVHLLSHVTIHGRRRSVQDLRIMLLTVSDDIRTVLINLCDRCYLLSRLHHLPPEERRRICQDVIDLFAPVAARLGIYSIKHALESAAFPELYPSDAESIGEQVAQMHQQNGDFLNETAKQLTDYLEEHGVRARVIGREKQLYSLFSKMRQKSLSHVSQVQDFYALRVVVDALPDCYQALGLIHRIARPVPNRFKDYIAFPKPNGYQSLHTTVMQLPGLTEDQVLEVQVRTQGMHREAEYGVAAHWSYKEYGSTALALEQAQLHQVLASQELLEQESGPRLVDHIFVLTPKGDVIELPEGSTPLDFAFQLHTNLGLSFRGARVNGAMVPIDYQMENGDVVEILKHSAPRPSPQWFQLLRMSSARSKLRRYLSDLERPQLIAAGRQVLNEQLRKRGYPVLDTELSILRVFEGQQLTVAQREDILVKLGQGSERASALLLHLDAIDTRDRQHRRPTVDPHAATASVSPTVFLEGGMRMPTRFAKCCKPDDDPGQPIVGLIGRQGVVVVHRSQCRMLKQANRARQLEAFWR